jgi:K+-sensing histidine kinase KdpD
LNEVPNEVMVNYNPAYLESVLYILSNSIRYSHPDRNPIITIKWLSEDEMKVLHISDNGVGIDLVKNADKIFGMYKTFSNNPESKRNWLIHYKKTRLTPWAVRGKPNMGTTFKNLYSMIKKENGR